MNQIRGEERKGKRKVAIINKQTQCENTDERRDEKINTPKIYLYINHFINDFRLFLRGFEAKKQHESEKQIN